MLKQIARLGKHFLTSRKALFLSAMQASSLAMSADLYITAEFKPDPLNPTTNKFINTTPPAGHSYCHNYPQFCTNGISSTSLPFGLQSSATIQAAHTDPRKGLTIKVPTEWRDVQVISSVTGDVQTLKFRVTGFGAIQKYSPAVSIITGIDYWWDAHTAIWEGGQWASAPAPCLPVGGAGGNTTTINFFMLTPSSSACSKKALFDIPSLTLEYLDIAYELVTPDPLGMSAGEYKATVPLIYSIGPGADFDFGDVMTASDGVLNINFTLNVHHVFNVQFPVGADRLSLVPDGGWQQWLQRGRRPEKLFANQSFQIWSSTTFKMLLQCQYPVGDHCGIKNGAGDLVPVETRVTLPTGIVALTSMPVNRYPLSNSNASVFHPSQYVDNGRAALHFEVSRDSVEQMTNHAGSRYSGNVTTVFDSEL